MTITIDTVESDIVNSGKISKPVGGIHVGENNVLKSFATLDPYTLNESSCYTMPSLVNGEWVHAKETYDVVDPLNGQVFIKASNVQLSEITPFVDSLKKISKSGLHNPLKNVDRYVAYGKIHHNAAAYLDIPEVFEFFVKLIQRVMPKSYTQAAGEIKILQLFFENFSGDRVRMLCRGFTQPGDYTGQESCGYRWPYGPVAVISPFNFPLEIIIMQIMSALMVGNKALVKAESRVSVATEQFIRFLHICGMPKTDLDFISCRGPVIEEVLKQAEPRMLQFTGSSSVADKLIGVMKGKIKIEDAGFDWKILGPDVPQNPKEIESIFWQCDQDAYAISGQKCSAQSMLMMHKNWESTDIISELTKRASMRSLEDLTITPVLSHTNKNIQDHVDSLLKLEGAKVWFGGKPVTGHSVPPQFGCYEPTAVFVPLKSILSSKAATDLCTTEIFGPLQVVTSYGDSELEDIIKLTELIPHHLTAAVVSKDMQFLNYVLGNTVNGTTYGGVKARTTGAPQNHWFGPAGNPLAAGIGTSEAVLATWTCHREIIFDHGPVTTTTFPKPT